MTDPTLRDALADPLEIPDDWTDTDLEPVDGDDAASRLLWRLGFLEADAADIAALAAAERTRIDEWESDRLAGIERARRYLHARLEGFARARHERTGVKTVKLPGGELRLRARSESLLITDPDAALAWAKTRPDVDELTTTIVKPVASAVKRHVKAGTHVEAMNGWEIVTAVDPDTGEVVPGVAIRRSVHEQTFTPRPEQVNR